MIYEAFGKRLLDIVVAGTALIVLAPLLAVLAIGARLSSPGPAIFRQVRIGTHGAAFEFYKFRSMPKNTGNVASDQIGRIDIRPFGKFLRRSNLDELPQLFNILRGDMSLVGPRPEREHFVDQLAEDIPWFRQRHLVKPGVTGWAQINYPYGNTSEDARQKLQYDLFYIKYSSLLFDLSILLNTAKTVVLRRGT